MFLQDNKTRQDKLNLFLTEVFGLESAFGAMSSKNFSTMIYGTVIDGDRSLATTNTGPGPPERARRA